MYVGNPLLVLLPDFDHGSGRLLSLIVNTDRTITEASDKDIAFDLIRCQGGDAGTRSCGQVLQWSVQGICLGEVMTHTSAYFSACVPNSYHLDVPSY